MGEKEEEEDEKESTRPSRRMGWHAPLLPLLPWLAVGVEATWPLVTGEGAGEKEEEEGMRCGSKLLASWRW